jgi:hypothetical protein
VSPAGIGAVQQGHELDEVCAAQDGRSLRKLWPAFDSHRGNDGAGMTKVLANGESVLMKYPESAVAPPSHQRQELPFSRTTVRMLSISTGCKCNGRRNREPAWWQQSSVWQNSELSNNELDQTVARMVRSERAPAGQFGRSMDQCRESIVT